MNINEQSMKKQSIFDLCLTFDCFLIYCFFTILWRLADIFPSAHTVHAPARRAPASSIVVRSLSEGLSETHFGVHSGTLSRAHSGTLPKVQTNKNSEHIINEWKKRRSKNNRISINKQWTIKQYFNFNWFVYWILIVFQSFCFLPFFNDLMI